MPYSGRARRLSDRRAFHLLADDLDRFGKGTGAEADGMFDDARRIANIRRDALTLGTNFESAAWNADRRPDPSTALPDYTVSEGARKS